MDLAEEESTGQLPASIHRLVDQYSDELLEQVALNHLNLNDYGAHALSQPLPNTWAHADEEFSFTDALNGTNFNYGHPVPHMHQGPINEVHYGSDADAEGEWEEPADFGLLDEALSDDDFEADEEY